MRGATVARETRDATGATVPVAFAGDTLFADASGALWWPVHSALVVADLHLEKGSAFARHGTMLPPYDTRETLSRLEAVIARYEPATIIALGDSLHDVGGGVRMGESERALLQRLQNGRRWVWITGNHDPVVDQRLGGERAGAFRLGAVALRHAPTTSLDGACELVGHLHPAARVVVQGRTIRRRCFICDEARLVLPAFGAFAGGLNVLDAAFDGVIARERASVLAIGDVGVYPVPSGLLRRD